MAANATIEKLYGAENLDISYEPSTGILFCDWKGFQSSTVIQKCGAVILDFTRQKNVTKVLNDNTYVEGSWWEAAEWAAEKWFPEMIDSGLKHFAWILSRNVFAELSAKKAMKPHTGIVKWFRSKEEAKQWLQNQEVLKKCSASKS